MHVLQGLIFDEITDVFKRLSSMPKVQDVIDSMLTLERFAVLMYDRTSNCLDVNSCRQELFVKKGRPMDALPLTSAALFQYSVHAAYQAGHVWKHPEPYRNL